MLNSRQCSGNGRHLRAKYSRHSYLAFTGMHIAVERTSGPIVIPYIKPKGCAEAEAGRIARDQGNLLPISVSVWGATGGGMIFRALGKG